MANNSIKAKFRNKYQNFEENLSDKSKAKLKELNKLNVDSLYYDINNLIKLLDSKYSKILSDLAVEYDIPLDELKSRMATEYIWDHYEVAIDNLNEPIRKYKTEEEFNKEFEEMFGPLLKQTDEERAYWNALHMEINGCDELFDYEERVNEKSKNEYPIKQVSKEDNALNELAHKVEEILLEKLMLAVKETEDELNITGQVIDFLIDLSIDKNIIPQDY